MYRLVIAEKPSVAKSLAWVLGATGRRNGYLEGNGYLVSRCSKKRTGMVSHKAIRLQPNITIYR